MTGAAAAGVPGHRPGEPAYRALGTGLFAAGMTTFMAMYAPQAVLPGLTADFGVGIGASTLAVSATTALVALAVVPAGALSERFGRIPVMRWGALAAGLLGLLVPWSPTFGVLVVLRALQGLALAGVPAVAMAYLAEEVDRAAIGRAMGRYVAGTTVGGLGGRLLTALALDVVPWRWALTITALPALAFTVVFLRTVPPSRRFVPQRVRPAAVLRHLRAHLTRPALLALFSIAFLLMGGFVSVYNLLGFRLGAPPFSLPQAVVGLVFCAYLAGTASSSVAGRLADRFGRARVLLVSVVLAGAGLALTLAGDLATVLVGLVVFTAGFFAAHAVASGWVGVLATEHRAEASALYLLAYYAGSAALGSLVAVGYGLAGWPLAVGSVGLLLAAALLAAVVAARDPAS